MSEDFLDEKTWLEFDGINWKAEIYMNGEYLGRMFQNMSNNPQYVVRHFYRGENGGKAETNIK